ncbi:SulP family inorganic anion transporter, partial [Escherichia coli]|nr:SulP family inorganic anion transporter [Escherichia coli]
DIVARFMDPSILAAALAIAFIASAETLLSAAAVDRMHDGVRTNYTKELRAQGIGNLLCGIAGALPMTGVIVRSSANVQAGAKTRASTMLHGIWILGFVALLPFVLREIPMAALGAILVVTGW